MVISVTGGKGGTGKSTIARIIRSHICKVPDDYITLNASLHGRIDTIRSIILPFLQTPPLASSQKLVYFDIGRASCRERV